PPPSRRRIPDSLCSPTRVIRLSCLRREQAPRHRGFPGSGLAEDGAHTVLKILTFDAPSLLAALRSGYFRRAHRRITTASPPAELLERAEVMRPEVIILVAGTGKRSVPRQLRAHLAGLRPLLLLAVPRERRALEEDLRSYDGILSLEEPELDLTRM